MFAERLLSGYMQLSQSILEANPSLKESAVSDHKISDTLTKLILNTKLNSKI
jgi:hypothetical protein